MKNSTKTEFLISVETANGTVLWVSSVKPGTQSPISVRFVQNETKAMRWFSRESVAEAKIRSRNVARLVKECCVAGETVTVHEVTTTSIVTSQKVWA